MLVIFDGLRLYEPFHLKDFQSMFSVLDSRAIASIDFYSGGFPANYGDRMSGVMDIETMPATEARHYEVGLSLFSSSFLSSGTFQDNRGEWLASLRRGNLDLLIDVANPDLGDPSYADGLVRLGYRISDSTRVEVNGLISNDKIAISNSDQSERSSAKYKNGYLWLNLENDWFAHLSSETIFSYTGITNDRNGGVNQPGISVGHVDDDRRFTILGLNQDWRFTPSDRYLALWGIDAKRLDGEYAYMSSADFSGPLASLPGSPGATVDRDINAAFDGEQYAAYLTNRIRLHPSLTADIGLRWDRQTYAGLGGQDQLSPRLSLFYKPDKKTEVRASWGRFHQSQGINELQVEDGLVDFFEAQRSEHSIISVERKFNNGTHLRIEVYRKNIANPRPRFENLFNPLVLLPELEPDRIRVDPDRAEVKGIEVLVASDSTKPFSWWISYTRSTVKDIIDDMSVLRNWDQKHAVKLGANWEPKQWNFSLAGTYHSGWPTTTLSIDAGGASSDPANIITSTGPRNAERFDPFLSFDFRVSRHRLLARGSLTYFVEVTNLLNRSNPCCTEYSLQQLEDGTFQLLGQEEHWLGLVPSIGFVWEF